MSRLLFLAAVTAGALVAALWPRHVPRSFAAAEAARLRAHFDSVEWELRQHDGRGLTSAQRAARARALSSLHAYSVRSAFPQNTDFPGDALPYFIDRRGRRCAMAYLIEQSGGRDLVARVAATHNNARISELKDDPKLVAWLSENGITLAEAARIQPTYCGLFGNPPCPPPEPSTGYKVLTGVAVGANLTLAALTLNVLHTGMSRDASAALGVGTGAAEVAFGLTYLLQCTANCDHPRSYTLALLNTGLGAASMAVGIYGLTRAKGPDARVTVGPWFGGGTARGLAARVAL